MWTDLPCVLEQCVIDGQKRRPVEQVIAEAGVKALTTEYSYSFQYSEAGCGETVPLMEPSIKPGRRSLAVTENDPEDH